MLGSAKMQALIKFSVIITLAALSLSGSSAWATDENSFVAKAKLNSFNLVPPVLSEGTAEVTLPFSKPTPAITTGEFIALAQREFNPWRLRIRRPGISISNTINNIRLYFGQHFADGQPIATLCDVNIDKECPPLSEAADPVTGERTLENDKFTLELRDIQFQPLAPNPDNPEVNIDTGRAITDGDVNGINRDTGRVNNDETGVKLIKGLIKQGLIYVVINSKYEAKLGPETDEDPETDDIIYTPPAPDPTNPDPEAKVVTQRDLTTQFRDLFLIVDGEFRGTLCLVSHKKC